MNTPLLYESSALSFDDILLVPQHSNVPSRTVPVLETQLTRNIKVKHPIVSTNMSTITESDMMRDLWSSGSYGFMHRFMKTEHYQEQLQKFAGSTDSVVPAKAIISIGVKGEEINNGWLDNEHLAGVIIDIAHGDSDSVCNTIEEVKTKYPHLDVIAGNIATRHGFMRMVNAGADAVRVGIGGGCFTPGSLVKTEHGLKPIQDICVNDMVYTHLGELQKVVELFIYEKDEKLCVINDDIECTENHEFYVLHKSHQDSVNESNIHQYAEWVSASDLNENYFLIELG